MYAEPLHEFDTTVVLVVLPREPAAPVLRTVASLLARTPPQLLGEILLVRTTAYHGVP